MNRNAHTPQGAEVRRRARARFAAVALGLLVAGIGGYAGFVAFVGSDRGVATGTLLLAATTGFVAFFSPCSFPLLLTFLSRRAHESPRAVVASAMGVGLGAASLLALVGVVAAFGGEALAGLLGFDSVSGRVFRLLIGALLVVLGFRQTGWLRLRMRWLDRVAASTSRLADRSRRSSRLGGDVAYGFGYLLAGFG